MLSEKEILDIIKKGESEKVEFKEVNNIKTTVISKICCGIANMRGGHLFIGVKDNGEVVGTKYLLEKQKFNNTKREIYDQIKINVDIDIMKISGNRVLVFTIPSRPTGDLVSTQNNEYFIRKGDTLLLADKDCIIRIEGENNKDYSNNIVEGANEDNLDSRIITTFMNQVDDDLYNTKEKQMYTYLEKLNLIQNKKITLAALAMFGKEEALKYFLPQRKTVVEFRRNHDQIHPDLKHTFESGFLDYLFEISSSIKEYTGENVYNDGLFRKSIDVFSMDVVREALLNAFCHRDYTIREPIEIKVSRDRLRIISPGGFPKGINIDNIIDEHRSRNPLIADSLQRWRLVEKAGEGFDKMWQSLILEGKNGPDISESSKFTFKLKLDGRIIDKDILSYINRNVDKIQVLSIHKLLALHNISKGLKPNIDKSKLDDLLDGGLIEKHGYGKGTRYILPKQFYLKKRNKGEYTKYNRLPDSKNKELILKHINVFGSAQIRDLESALEIERRIIHRLLNEMREDGIIEFKGAKRTGVWIKCG